MGFLFTIAGVVLLGLAAYGGQVIYVASQSGQMVSMTCADFVRARPAGLWVSLERCRVVFGKTVTVRKRQSGTKESFAPLEPAGAPEGASATILLKLGDEDTRLLDELSRVGSGSSRGHELIRVLADRSPVQSWVS
jgi:hypothetical protein